MCLDILNNEAWYKPISFAVADRFMVDFYQLIDDPHHAGTISKNIWAFLRTPHPRLSTFCCLPKVHKPGATLRGRPIVSGSGNLTEHASTFIDKILKPHVESLFSFIRDTMSFLKFTDGISAPPAPFL